MPSQNQGQPQQQQMANAQ